MKKLASLLTDLCPPIVFTYIWQKDVAKISKVPGAQRDVNPARQ